MKKTAALFASLVAAPCFALPELDQVISGDISIEQGLNSLQINQASQQAEVNFTGFDIGANESVVIAQPNSSSLLIGNIHHGQASEISGQLSANGQVFLINPSGFVFHDSAQVDTQALLLSTLNQQALSENSWGLSGDAESQASIINRGDIRAASSGAVLMIAAQVINQGSISADKGRVVLANAEQALLQFSDSGLNVSLDKAALQSLIQNEGVITADGGLILLTQAATDSVLSQQILQQGLVRADRIDNVDGEIRLVSSGDVINSGSINAASGALQIKANRFGLSGDIDVSGADTPSGSVFVEAGDKLVLNSQARISANADANDGGEVILKAFDSAIFASGAKISATSVDGDGGFVEISARNNLSIQGLVDTSSTYGDFGEFLIDPIDIEITNQTNAVVFSDGIFSATASGAQLDVDDINQQLQNSNVTITTTGAGSEQGDIDINAVLDLDGGQSNTLAINADGNINVNQAIVDSDYSNSDQVQLNMTAGGNVNIAASAGIDVDAGKMRIVAGGNMNLTGLRSSNNANDAIFITVGNSIFDAGDVNPDIASPGGVALLQGVGFVDQFERVDLNAPTVPLPPVVVANPIDEVIESIIETQVPQPEVGDTHTESVERVFAQVFACQINQFDSHCALDRQLQGFLDQMLVGGSLPE